MRLALALMSILLLSSAPVDAGEPKVLKSAPAQTPETPPIPEAPKVDPAVAIEIARAELAEAGARIATGIQAKLVASCEALSAPPGLTLTVRRLDCESVKVSVNDIYIGSTTRPGFAGIVTFNEQLPGGEKLKFALLFMRQGPTWGVFPEDFKVPLAPAP